MRRFLASVVACLSLPAVAQQLTPAQQAILDQRYRRANTNIPPESVVNTALTEAVTFSGIVTGKYDRLGPTVDWVRFNPVSNCIERLSVSGSWERATGDGSLRVVYGGGNTNSDVQALGLASGTTNVNIGHLMTGPTSVFTISISGAVGPRGFDGAGLVNGGSWSSGTGYSTNTVVTYGNVVYLSVAGVTSAVAPPNDSVNWSVWLVGGTNGVNGIDGIDGTGFRYRGDWDIGSTYSSDDLVRASAALYRGVTPSTGVYPAVTSGWSNYWQLVLSDGQDGAVVSPTNILVYAPGSAYTSGVFVVYAGQTYATLNPTAVGEAPGTSTNWVLAASKGADGANGADGNDGVNGIGGMFWYSNWVSTITYPRDCLVTKAGVIYFSKLVNSGVDPELDFGRGTWDIAAAAADGSPGVYLGFWSNSVVYTNRAMVRQTNTFYYSLSSGNVGNSPVSSPAYWERMFDATEAIAGMLTNALATNSFLTASVSAGQVVIGATATPIFVESDPVWSGASTGYFTKTQSSALFATGTPLYVVSETSGLRDVVSRGSGVDSTVYVTNARVVFSGSTNSSGIQFADGSTMGSAGVLSSVVTNLPYTGSNMVEQYITSNTNMISGVIPAPPPGWRRLRWWFSGFGTNISPSAEVVMQLNGYTNPSFYSLVVQQLYSSPNVASSQSTNYPGLKIGRTWGPSAANSNNLNYFEVVLDNPWNTNFPSHTSSFYSKVKQGNGLVPINSQTLSESGYHVYSVPGVITSFVVRYEVDGKFLTNSMWGWSYLP